MKIETYKVGHDSARINLIRPNGSWLTIKIPVLESPSEPEDFTNTILYYQFYRPDIDRIGIPTVILQRGSRFDEEFETNPKESELYKDDHTNPAYAQYEGDEGIHMLGHMIHSDNEHALVEIYGGSAFWACHDIIHAINDMDPEDGKYRFVIEGSNEEQTLIEGALLALKIGVSISDIIRSLVSQEKPFDERFGYDGTFLRDFLDKLEVRVKV